jgi:predicted small lipoprotein YifL
MRKLISTGLVLAGMLALTACGQGTSAEKQGEKMDSAIEEATGQEIDRGDGVMGNAGEVIDDVTGQENDDPVDAIHDATEEATDPS